MGEFTKIDRILLFDTYSVDSRNLHVSFQRAGYDLPAVVIDDDGFLPEGVMSVYGFFLGNFKGEKGVPGKPRYFNQITVPDYWEISGNNSSGKVHDLYRERGRIFYAEPKHKRLVKVVDWYDERGTVRSSDHYNRYGALFARTAFNAKGQRVNKSYFSAAGREILVEVTYSKEESGTIRYLERISQKKVPCFLGKVSLRNGRIRMYPVDLPEIEEPMEETERQGAKDGTGEEDLQAEEERIVMGRKSAFDVMEDLTEEIMSLMEDLYQSGFDTVHDSTLKDIRKASELTEQYGMAWLSQMLASLAGEIEAGRHSLERKTADMAGLYTDISEYLYLCGQKTAYDRGRKYYKG